MRALGLAAALLACALVAAAGVDALRGVKKSDEPLYAGATFTCRDGSKTIDSAYVNDDYCDCPSDGSDEPGTSACAQALALRGEQATVAGRGFWCANRGWRGAFIPNSRVNDGICDCCDGSDEYGGASAPVAVVCENTCVAKGEEASRGTVELIGAIEAGVTQRAQWVAAAKALKQTREQQLAEEELALQNLQSELDAAIAARDTAERAETAERDRRSAEFEAERKAAEEKALAEAAAKPPAPAAATSASEAVAQGMEASVAAAVAASMLAAGSPDRAAAIEAANAPLPTAGEPVAPAAPATGEAGSAFPYPADYAPPPTAPAPGAAEEKFPYPAEYAAPPTQPPAAPIADVAVDDFEDDPNWDPAPADGETAELGGATGGAAPAASAKPAAPAPPTYKSEEAEKLRDAVRALEQRKRTAENSVNAVRQLLEHNYGAELQFSELQGKCFEWKQRQYTYVICPYDRAEQKEGSSTSLGKWKGFGEGEESGADGAKPVLLFSGGARCWQGPERSLTVTLQCGKENELSNVEEPNKCVYTALFKTPAVCREQDLTALRAQLAAARDGADE